MDLIQIYKDFSQKKCIIKRNSLEFYPLFSQYFEFIQIGLAEASSSDILIHPKKILERYSFHFHGPALIALSVLSGSTGPAALSLVLAFTEGLQ